MVEALYKDAPAAGDVHVNAPLGGARKKPFVQPDASALEPGRPIADVLDEIELHGLAKANVQPQTLYVSRDLLNADEVIAWAKGQGFKTTYPADEMHVTIVFSRNPVNWMEAGQSCYSIDGKADLMVPEGGPRMLEVFGLKQNCAVLLFASSELQWRHEWLAEIGCSWDWDDYTPHITISQDIEGLDLTKMEPYQGKLHFGPEIFAQVKENAMAGVVEKQGGGFVAKVDVEHGLAFGFGIVCSKGGQPYFDTQNDHVPEDAMIEASVDFMRKSREAHDMHRGRQQGDVVFAMPITAEIRKFIMESDETGLLIGMAPSAEVLGKFKSGEYGGFSIGGERIDDEEAV